VSGAGGSINTVGVDIQNVPGVHVQVDGPNAQAGLVCSASDTATGSQTKCWDGAQANVGGVSATVGGPDNNVRGGVSEGVGLGARAGTRDDTIDGTRTYTLGADIGPFSGDVTVTSPGLNGPPSDYGVADIPNNAAGSDLLGDPIDISAHH
jgi:hypothetical protein